MNHTLLLPVDECEQEGSEWLNMSVESYKDKTDVLAHHYTPKNKKNVSMLPVISLGGFSEEAEVPGIKYILSPYTLNLVATPLFLKPGIPYSIKVDGEEKPR